MNSLIDRLKTVPLSNTDIINACDGKTKIVLYSDLYKYKSIDALLKPYDCVVLLYETKPRYGHWVCLLKYGNTVEFFDSYGYFIDEQLKFINNDFKKQNHEDKPYLSMLLLQSPYKLISNNYNFQKKNKDVASCGRHVCLRLILRDLNLKQYTDLFKNDKNNADSIVTYLTAFI